MGFFLKMGTGCVYVSVGIYLFLCQLSGLFFLNLLLNWHQREEVLHNESHVGPFEAILWLALMVIVFPLMSSKYTVIVAMALLNFLLKLWSILQGKILAGEIEIQLRRLFHLQLLCTEMCKNISNRLSEIAPAGRRTLRCEIRLPILYLFTQLST